MYHTHFGFEQAPFKITPDPRLFFPGGNRGAVLEALVYAIANGEGIVKVVGEVGSGKTMLCRMLEQELPDNVEVVYLANPNLGPNDILHAIAFELKIPTANTDSRLAIVHKLQDFLLEKHAQNRRVVAFIEEAQGMPLATLEEIRLLSNLETSQDKLLQIVLFGQPELDETLAAHEIRQLKERITYSFRLEPFGVEEIEDYVNSRLRASGYRGFDLFERSAIKEVSRASDGLLRRVNILGDKALLAAYADNATRVKRKHARRAVQDSEFGTMRSSRPRIVMLSGLAALAVTAALLGWSVWVPRSGAPANAAGDDAGPAAVSAPETSPAGPARALKQEAKAASTAASEPTVTSPAAQTQLTDVNRDKAEIQRTSETLLAEPLPPAKPLPGLLTLESFAPDDTILLDIKGLGALAGARSDTKTGG